MNVDTIKESIWHNYFFISSLVKQNRFSLQLVPDEYRIEKLCKLAVQRDGVALKFVPKDQRTKEICELAAQKNGSALELVQDQYRSEEIGNLSEEQIDLMTMTMFMTAWYNSEEMCKLFVQKIGLLLEWIPEDKRTKEICELAVQQDGLALQFVPNRYRTEEIYKLAVQQNGLALKFVPDYILDATFSQAIIAYYGETYFKETTAKNIFLTSGHWATFFSELKAPKATQAPDTMVEVHCQP